MPLHPNKKNAIPLSKVRKAVRKMMQDVRFEQPVVVGKGAGYSHVKTGVANQIWVTHEITGMTQKVWSLNMSVKAGLRVLIGEDKTRNPGIVQVLRERTIPGVAPQIQLPPHGETHSEYGGDPTEVFGGQFHPLNAIPIPDTFIALIKDAIILAGNVWAYVPEQNVNLTASVPTAGAKWALLQADDAGLVTAKFSAIVTSRSLLTIALIPLADINCFPMVAIKLFDGQTSLRRDQGRNDFFDLRWGNGYLGGGLGTVAGDMLKSVYDPQLIEDDAFDTDNHTDGLVNAFYTLAERAKLLSLAPAYQITEDLTAQIDGIVSHFDLTWEALVKCSIYGNLRQLPADVTMDADMLGFTLSYVPTTADSLIVDYYPRNASTLFVYDDAGNLVIDENGEYVFTEEA